MARVSVVCFDELLPSVIQMYGKLCGFETHFPRGRNFLVRSASLPISVKRERLGNGRRGGSHQKVSTSRKMSPKTTQLTIHLNNRRKELIEAYNRDPGHRIDLEVDA